MFSHLITLILGFAAGCTIREILGSSPRTPSRKQNEHYNGVSPITTRQMKSSNETNKGSGFSLQSLRALFSSYGVGIHNAGSLGILLRKIRSTCYKEILKLLIDNASTPEQMVELLTTQVISDKNFTFNETVGEPYIQSDKIDAYIIEEGVSLSEFRSNKEKVSFLLSLYYAKGIDDFKNTLGTYMSDIISANERGEDISSLYNEIMNLVKNRYSYLS